MGGTRELVADAVPATSRHVARCASCSAALLRCDFHGRSAAHMDVALARHRSGYCVRADAAVADAAFALTSLLDGLEGGGIDVPSAPWPNEEPPIVFAARHGLYDLACRLLDAGCLFGAQSLDHIAPSGQAAIHLAAARDDARLVGALLKAHASPHVLTQDSTSDSAFVGGSSPLHCAAASGAQEAARVLLSASPALAATPDWDGQIPARAAMISGHRALALTLAQAAELEVAERAVGSADGGELAELVREVLAELDRDVLATGGNENSVTPNQAASSTESRALRRLGQQERESLRLWIGGRAQLHVCHLLRGLWSADDCAWLLSEVSIAAGLHGWHGARHRHYSTEDLPLWRAPRAARWVRDQVRCRIFPAMAAVFGIPIDRLRLQECFAVRYEASGQPSLAMHRDETLLSFNVSLSDGFEGGGTCFAKPTSLREWADGGSDLCTLDSRLPSWTPGSEGSAVSAVRGERGDCLVHSGQLLHAGAAVTRGTRIIVVGFVSELMRSGDHEARATEMYEGPGELAAGLSVRGA